MNRSALFLSVAALLLVSACSKQQSSGTAPSSDALPPAEQTAPAPSDSTAVPPSDTTATPPPADSSTSPPPPADSGTADPGATPPRQ
jgi:hypothetical protein